MEPNRNIIGPPTELPQPEEINDAEAANYNVAPAPEKRGLKQATPVVPVQNTPQPAKPDPQPSVPGNDGTDTSDDDNSQQAALIADDTDLIEKEWVTRAKSIVAQTKDDPHLQNREMNKVKADYMKKRYNKDLKVSES